MKNSKSVGSDTVWVRVPPSAPRRSKLYIACSDFFQKVRARSCRCSSSPNRTRCTGLRFGLGCWPEKQHLYCCDVTEQIPQLLHFCVSCGICFSVSQARRNGVVRLVLSRSSSHRTDNRKAYGCRAYSATQSPDRISGLYAISPWTTVDS